MHSQSGPFLMWLCVLNPINAFVVRFLDRSKNAEYERSPAGAAGKDRISFSE